LPGFSTPGTFAGVSDAPATPDPVPRYRLGTFGTVALRGSADEMVLGQHGQHRRRLALLAALAVSGSRGRTRDQLLALFWPEATQSRARHSLDQLLYALRSTLDESLFASGDPVRLNPAVLTSDVEAFEAALDRDDLAAAAELHRGSFLDGFHLGDSAEFEQWLDAERARLERRYVSALERLAERAEGAGDRATAVEWRRRLAELDPLSGRNAAGLMRALMNAGDHSAALKHAERYEALVTEELGTSAGPEVSALVAQIRAEAAASAVVRARPATMGDGGSRQPRLETTLPLPPPGVDRSVAPPPAQPTRSRRSMALGLAMLAFIATAVVVTVVALRAASHPARPAAGEPTIAVLPFTNVGGDRGDSVLADGIGEELRQALARIERAHVLARGSATELRKRGADVRRVADSLGATHLVAGSVQWSGPRLRIEVRLVDAASGATRWSESFDRDRQEMFLVQGDVATAVARELGLVGDASIRALRRGPTQNIAAYELYLRGRDPVNFRSDSDSGPRAGLAYLRQAVALDSNFAAAYAYMPGYYIQLAAIAPSMERVRAYQRMADSMARRAVVLDSLLPEAHMALAATGMLGLSDPGGAERALRRAIALGGAPRVHEHLAQVLVWTGRPEEALAEARRAAEEDPLSATATAELGKMLCVNHRYDEGHTELARVSNVRPRLLRVPGYLATCYVMQHRWREAAAQLHDPQQRRLAPLLGYALARSGDTVAARAIRDGLLQRWRTSGRGAADLALVTAGLGDLDQAFVWLDRSVDDLSLGATTLFPVFDELRADPRYDRFLARLGAQKR
jgi:DNA-binding SARP family transcriptional activator/TolB-like protein